MKHLPLLPIFLMALLISACDTSIQDGDTSEEMPTYEERFKALQRMLIEAQPGDTVELPSGEFFLESSLSLIDVDNVTIRGRGIDKTVLSFIDQKEGAEGIKIRSDNVVLEDFTVQDMSGDGIKVEKSDGVTFRRIRVKWTGGSDTSNGGYGLYPVACKNVLIEYCGLYNASDAGIYVGQSENVIIRHNRAARNVQGIAIENCNNVDVYENVSENNTAGISVYNLPDLPLIKRGEDIRVFNNKVLSNNYENFGAKGAIVGIVPAGTGIFVLAGKDVEIFDNEITNHQTASTGIISYPLTGRPLTDSLYYPFTTSVYVHGNTYSRSDAVKPDLSRELGQLVNQLFGENPPHILYDGIVDPVFVAGGLPQSERICIRNNTGATFANINAPSGFTNVMTDKAPYDCEQEPLNEVQIRQDEKLNITREI